MSKRPPHRALTYLIVAVCAFAFAALFIVWDFPDAEQISTKFLVLINLKPDEKIPNSGLCGSSATIGVTGRAVTVICATLKAADFTLNTRNMKEQPLTTTQGSAYHFVIPVPESVESRGTVHSYAGIGTVSSWRKVILPNWDYLEVMVSW